MAARLQVLVPDVFAREVVLPSTFTVRSLSATTAPFQVACTGPVSPLAPTSWRSLLVIVLMSSPIRALQVAEWTGSTPGTRLAHVGGS